MGLNTEKIQRCIETLEPMFSLHIFDEVTSTNDVLKEYLSKDKSQNVIIISELQTEGRGRFNRTWLSPSGGLYFSFGFPSSLSVEKLPCLGLVASNAIIYSLNALSIPVKAKWPNDILLYEKKIGGILSEMIVDKQTFIIIGIGLNLNFSMANLPTSLSDSATTIIEELGQVIEIEEVLCRFLSAFTSRLKELHKTQSLSPILEEWRKYSSTLGRDVLVDDGGSQITGTAIDINEFGSLIVNLPTNHQMIFQTGDVKHLKHLSN